MTCFLPNSFYSSFTYLPTFSTPWHPATEIHPRRQYSLITLQSVNWASSGPIRKRFTGNVAQTCADFIWDMQEERRELDNRLKRALTRRGRGCSYSDLRNHWSVTKWQLAKENVNKLLYTIIISCRETGAK
jgi:hypothetical protein